MMVIKFPRVAVTDGAVPAVVTGRISRLQHPVHQRDQLPWLMGPQTFSSLPCLVPPSAGFRRAGDVDQQATAPVFMVSIALVEFCQENGLSHPGFLVLDSPLLAYYKPEGEDDVALQGTDLKKNFMTTL